MTSVGFEIASCINVADVALITVTTECGVIRNILRLFCGLDKSELTVIDVIVNLHLGEFLLGEFICAEVEGMSWPGTQYNCSNAPQRSAIIKTICYRIQLTSSVTMTHLVIPSFCTISLNTRPIDSLACDNDCILVCKDKGILFQSSLCRANFLQSFSLSREVNKEKKNYYQSLVISSYRFAGIL